MDISQRHPFGNFRIDACIHKKRDQKGVQKKINRTYDGNFPLNRWIKNKQKKRNDEGNV